MKELERALDREHSVLRYMLERHARETPEALFVHFWPSIEWDYRTTLDKVRRRAATLYAHGVRRGEHVLCFMGNGPDLLSTWFAINYLGAVYVPINTGARGRPLEHILYDADARLGLHRPPGHAERFEWIQWIHFAETIAVHGAAARMMQPAMY